MAIYSDDLKIKKSAVMADVPEGGGAMTGTDVLDGESNQVFNDISDDDRANGAFHLRKLFGVALTDDTDTLLGAGWVVLAPPADSNVDVACFQTDGWFDEREDALDLIESYIVKGSRLLCRVQDTHYAGTTLLQLYDRSPSAEFPDPGDAIFMVNPDGSEQRVRVLSIEVTRDVVLYDTNGEYTVNIASCTLNSELEIDILGKAPQRVAPDSTLAATVFSTTAATGATFHGVKPLAEAVVLGSETIRSVTVEGGIFAQLVPSTTTETPVVDVYPLVQSPTLSRTASASVTISTALVTLSAGSVLQLPVAVEPESLTMTHGSTSFTCNASGDLLQGTTTVGAIDWSGRTITMGSASPSYGSATNVISFRPATIAGATTYSDYKEVTEANQSTAFVSALEPVAAPGTYSRSYMSQGSWYTISDDGTGKVSGSSSAYGVGTISYVTGSVAGTMGALPDVGSAIIETWGEKDSARTATGLPSRAHAWVALDRLPDGDSLTFSWTSSTGAKVATVSSAGAVTGPAVVGDIEIVEAGGYRVLFSPNEMPIGVVDVSYTAPLRSGEFVNNGSGSYTLTDAPLISGSVRFTLVGSSGSYGKAYSAKSVGTLLYANGQVVGSINNTTGAMVLSGADSAEETTYTTTKSVTENRPNSGYFYTTTSETLDYTFDKDNVVAISYTPDDSGDVISESLLLDWFIDIEPPIGLSMVTTDAAFTFAGALYFVRDGISYKGWNQSTGATSTVGYASSEGIITLGTSPPQSSNAIVWSNIAHDARGSQSVFSGVFRVGSAPIKAGEFYLQAGDKVGSADSGGIITGDFVGTVDSERGIVIWEVADLGAGDDDGVAVRADEVTYNAIYLEYVPLDKDLLGVDTTGLPVDGKVPIYRSGGAVVVHNTQTFDFPNPLVKGTAYDLGRGRVSSVVVRDAVGTKVTGSLYEIDRTLGTVTILADSDISVYAEPFSADHRVQDELQVTKVDISGKLTLAAALSHDFPVPGSYVSSKLRQGDKYARVHSYYDRTTWSSSYDDTLAGSDTSATFNSVDYPITVTNRGAIKERWWAVFTNTTTVNVYGEFVGQVLTAQPIASVLEAINPQYGVAYWSIPAAGWGGGWATGNVLMWETEACGGPAWFAQSVLPGATEVLDDSATLGYIANVDTP